MSKLDSPTHEKGHTFEDKQNKESTDKLNYKKVVLRISVSENHRASLSAVRFEKRREFLHLIDGKPNNYDFNFN